MILDLPLKRRTAWSCGGPILMILLAAGCQQKPEATATEPPTLASALSLGDPASSPQLLKGFYGVEQGAWRWTAQQFSVALRPPAGSAQSGATLTFNFTVPDSTIQNLKTVTLSAAAGGTALAPETYSRPGVYAYQRDIAANLLAGGRVQIDFQLDKVNPPKPPDLRPLGVVAAKVGLDLK